MPNHPTTKQLSLEEKHSSIFPEDNRTYQTNDGELWLEQPSAQKIVRSTTSSPSFELPESLKED